MKTVWEVLPDWVEIRTGSNGANPWMDAVVFVHEEQVNVAAQACLDAMEFFWSDEGEASGMCYGDCIELFLIEAGVVFRAAYADFDIYNDDYPSEEWDDRMEALYRAGKIVKEAY